MERLSIDWDFEVVVPDEVGDYVEYRSANAALAAKDAAIARLSAIENAGHAEDCPGMDTSRGECGCGWLQREGAHKYIKNLEKDLAEKGAEIVRLEESRMTWKESCLNKDAEIAALKKEQTRLLGLCGQKDCYIADLLAEKRITDDVLKSLDNEISLSKQIAALKKEVEEKTREICALQGEIEIQEDL